MSIENPISEEESIKIKARKDILDLAISGTESFPPSKELWAKALGYQPENPQVKVFPQLYDLMRERLTAGDTQELILRIVDERTRGLFSNTHSSSVALLSAQALFFSGPEKVIAGLRRFRKDLDRPLNEIKRQ